MVKKKYLWLLFSKKNGNNDENHIKLETISKCDLHQEL